jgi:cyclophilin family peptidyl-prolyl cis-trans isomerase
MVRQVRTMLGCGLPRTSSLDRLEERSLLSTSPLPTLSQLENQNNAVIRFETNFGEFDVELFTSDTAVATTANNFLNYVTSGRFAETFFHRSIRRGTGPGASVIDVLQGGGFSFSNDAGFTQVSTDAPIPLQVVRPNAERTLSMARTNQVNSATSQFFINTLDNTTQLGPGGVDPNGYAVFGRIIQGWDSVIAMRNLTVRDLSSDPAFAGTGTLFSTVPTTAAYSQQSGVRENALATITNAEVIKTADVPGFYTIEQVMPEGWRSTFTTDSIDLYNPNSITASYQIIAHYEVSGKNTLFEDGTRDRVIASGLLNGSQRTRIRLSDRTDANFVAPVRLDEGYALVLKTAFAENLTDELPLTAEIIRNDFNSQVQESFINLSPDDGGLSTAQQREWLFPRIERNPLSLEFLTFWNPNAVDAPITINFVTPEGPRTFNITLNAYRRGGFGLADNSLPEGILAARVTSTQPIAVSLSDWDIAAEGQDVSRTSMPGFLVNGTPGGGAIVGGIAQVLGSTDGKGEISLYNPTSQSTTVNLTIYRGDGNGPTSQAVTVLARQRVAVDVGFGLTDNQAASVMYNSGSVAIAAQYTWIPPANRNVASNNRVDGAATMFRTNHASGVVLAGEFNPTLGNTGFRETISLFNPFNEQIGFSIAYRFTDGTQIQASTGSAIVARGRAQFDTLSFANVVSKINSAAEFRNYTILVSGGSPRPTAQDGFTPGIVSLFRDDTRQSRTILSNGDQIRILTQLSAPDIIGSAPGATG